MTKLPGVAAVACVVHTLIGAITATRLNAAAAGPRALLNDVRAIVAETFPRNACSEYETALVGASPESRSFGLDAVKLEEALPTAGPAKRESPNWDRYGPPAPQVPIRLVEYPKVSSKLLKDIDGSHDEFSMSEDLGHPPGCACTNHLAYAVAMVLSSYFREKRCVERCVFTLIQSKFKRMHKVLWDVAATTYTLTEAVRGHVPSDNPIQLAQCTDPGSAGCYNIFYSNVAGNSRMLHKLDFVPGTQEASQLRDATASDGKSEPMKAQAHGTYVFYDGDPDVQIAMGFNDDFPKKVATAVSEDAIYSKPAVSCLSLLDEDSQKPGVVGMLIVSPSQPSDDSLGNLVSWAEECSSQLVPSA
ncbi:hypothetical protein CB0940_05005 [Cercospora beticola]|uniref:Uncharacterized protein n=1 Tax=Cercospora beticola TaxID=122368 RepID=A0A2G5HKZ6_CERBT|nr:hypothetical protein CB0940_05005 [Cercospora beticola]PIA93227.1 hypothetical protein CB0940_05005 [Cercospora beticola]WPB02293.1 hypothetical protein RHO25_006927 [Cercospora beticola]CAK1362835.1 unnamed protein product [Cercospora beticola]